MKTYHGGCIGCTSQEIHEKKRCKICMYHKPDWSLADLSIKEKDMKKEEIKKEIKEIKCRLEELECELVKEEMRNAMFIDRETKINIVDCGCCEKLKEAKRVNTSDKPVDRFVWESGDNGGGSFWLSDDYDWEIKDCSYNHYKVLVPTHK